MKSLSGVDGVFLHLETAQTPMHVASLHLFDLPAGVTAIAPEYFRKGFLAVDAKGNWSAVWPVSCRTRCASSSSSTRAGNSPPDST